MDKNIITSERKLTAEEFDNLPVLRQLGMIAESLGKKAYDARKKIGAAAAATVLGFGAVAGGIEATTQHDVDSMTTQITEGNGGIEATCRAANELAEKHGLRPDDPDCISAGQRAQHILEESEGGVYPGQQFEVTITQSSANKLMGDYDVEVTV